MENTIEENTINSNEFYKTEYKDLVANWRKRCAVAQAARKENDHTHNLTLSDHIQYSISKSILKSLKRELDEKEAVEQIIDGLCRDFTPNKHILDNAYYNPCVAIHSWEISIKRASDPNWHVYLKGSKQPTSYPDYIKDNVSLIERARQQMPRK